MTDRLAHLLDDIYAAVLSGRYSALETATSTLEAFAADLPKENRALVAMVRDKAVRNLRCLEAALSGIRLAQRRVDEIEKAALGLLTYDAKGGTALLTQQKGDGRRA